MPAAPAALLKRLSASTLTDGECLRRYARDRDEAAFAEVVRRNGPLVLRACRSVLPDSAAADDAFQVTFLALARHAGRLTGSPSVAGWLYRAAVRSAGAIRRADARRRRRERAAVRPEADGGTSWAEVREAIDAALVRLPDTYRTPLVLCYVQGLGYDDAARRLGCSAGALRGRLERGRVLLRRRLQPLGLSVLAAAAAGLPAVSADLRAATLRTIHTAGPASCRVMIAMLAGGLALAAGGLALVAGAGGDPPRPPADRPTTTAPTPREVAVDALGDPLPPGAIARLGGERWRHDGEATSLAFTPDGRTLVVVSARSGVITFFETATGRPLYRLTDGGEARLLTLAVSPDGKLVAAQSGDRTVRVWDTKTKARVHTLKSSLPDFPPGQLHIAFSADSKRLAASMGDDLITVWDVTTGKAAATVTGHRHSNPALTLSPDGTTLAIAVGPTVQLRDSRTGAFLRGLNTDHGGAFSLVYSTDGKTLATSGRDRIILSEVETGKEIARLEAKIGAILNVALTPDGKTLLSATEDGVVRVWDVAARKVRLQLDSRGWIGRSMAVSADGKTVAMGTVCNVVRVWDVATGKELSADVTGHDAPVHAVAFSPDGKLLVTAGANKHIYVWDAATGRPLRRLTGASAQQISFSPDGRQLVSAWATRLNKLIRLWDVGRGEAIRTFAPDKADEVAGAAFAPDGTVVSLDRYSSPEKAVLHTWADGGVKSLREIDLPDLRPEALAVSPDGRWAVAGGGGNTEQAKLWLCDLKRARARRLAEQGEVGVASVAYSPDGRLLATGDYNRQARLWEVATGRELFLLSGHVRSVAAVAFSPDGRLLATADGQPTTIYWKNPTTPQTVRFWDVATGKELARLEGFFADVGGLAFSPDGLRLVGGLANGSVLVWEVPAIPRIAGAKLGREELAARWADLGGADARRAHAAVRSLAAAEDGVAFLAATVQPAAKPDAAKVRQWLSDLDDDRFPVREAAARELGRLGESVEPELRAALAARPSEEKRGRLERLLTALTEGPPQPLAELRAVWALELSGTPASRKVLEALAGGATDARLTREAKESIGRMR
jgi:RNA polymerase sigma factor (sigma-70 family)